MKLPGDSAVPAKISGVDAKSMRVAQVAAAQRRQEQVAPKPGSVEAESDVQLTGAARSLAALEQSLHSLPAVDEKRVAAVKRRLESGEYKIQPQRIADKLLHLESDLRRANPRESSSLK
jgi:negative regulator of flagellin synthesis FlgM